MDSLFHINMQAIINRSDSYSIEIERKHRTSRLRDGSSARKIVEYLFTHGIASGTEIIKATGIKNSPQAYIQPHLKAGRIITKHVSRFKNIYWINSGLTRKDFYLE